MLTPKQVMEELQISRPTLYRLIESGKLTGYKVGAQWRFRREDIESYLKEGSI